MATSVPGKEHRRAEVLTRVAVGTVTPDEAAGQLGISTRQVRRLRRSFSLEGPGSLVHGNRGRRSPRRLPDTLRARIVELATTIYAGQSGRRLGRLLQEEQQIKVSSSTVQRVLSEAGVRTAALRPRLPVGLMPVAFKLMQRQVELVDLNGADFREPYFHQTVERVRRERPLEPSVEIDFETFVRATRLEPGRPPDGFVFHVGRCGSTLLANMLSVPPEHLVIKESPAVNALVAGLLNAVDEPRRREREELVGLALPFMFRRTRGTERRLIFKLTSWNVRLADLLLRQFPATPAMFLYRSAGSTVASLLAEPPGWRDLLERPRAVQARFFPSLTQLAPRLPLSTTTFYAHTWRSAVEAALALPLERLLVVEYGELVGDPATTLRQIGEHFRLALEPSTLSAMTQAQAVYSKDPSGRATFDPAGSHRRPALSVQQEAEVASVVGDLAQRLAARRSTDTICSDRRIGLGFDQERS